MPNYPKERAQKLFNLVDPVDSPEWDEYIKVRDQGEWISTEFMCKEADEPDTYYRNLHSLAWKSISRALPDDKDLARRVADSIDVLSCWTRDEGDPVVWQPPHRSSKTISLTSRALRSTTQTSIRAYTPCTPLHGLICTLSTTPVLARISSNAPTLWVTVRSTALAPVNASHTR